MLKLKVIPVIDMFRGKIVLAYKGIREKYRELKNTVLTEKVDLENIVEALYSMGFREVYIADLDAIVHGKTETLKGKILNIVDEFSNIRFLIDIGRLGLQLKPPHNVDWVIGTEYLSFNDLLRLKPNVLSLDMFGNNVTFRRGSITLLEIVPKLKSLKPKEVLAIFLDRVGSLEGPNYLVASYLANMLSKSCRVIVGGGIRNKGDLYALKLLGVDAVLVATAIHKGIINTSEI